MRDTKPFASLSSGLLARKGAAKPAMRPQGFNTFGSNLEDLGWNDMGSAEEDEGSAHDFGGHHVPSPVTALTPSASRPAPEPAVMVSRRVLEETFAAAPAAPAEAAPLEASVEAAPVEAAPVEAERGAGASVVTLPRRRGAVKTGKAKAAFTLRLDPERHWKLRLASALTRQSAQQLVTGALDDFLDSLPELDALADRMPAEAGGQKR
jgi:hypothetical protein